MPEGRPPLSVNCMADGKPVAAMVKELFWPTRKMAPLELVIEGAWPTVRVKLCVASVPTPLWAVMVMLKVPKEPGVPARVAVPFILSVKITPVGREPDSVREGVGEPVVVTVNDPGWERVKVILAALVIADA